MRTLLLLTLTVGCATAAPEVRAYAPPAAPSPRLSPAEWQAQRDAAQAQAAEEYRQRQEEKERRRYSERLAREREAMARAQAAEDEKRAQRERWESAGYCRPGDADDVCRLGALVKTVCDSIALAKEEERAAKEERKNAKRFGVVDLSELQHRKEMAVTYEDQAKRLAAEVAAVRGRAFSRSECR